MARPRFGAILALSALLLLGACHATPEHEPNDEHEPVARALGEPAAPSPPTAPTAPTAPTGPGAPAQPAPPSSPTPPAGLVEFAPHVRLDRGARAVEFDAFVPLDLTNPETDVVYLEVIACLPDSKEHEALLVSYAKPSHVHAALLLLGLESGSPGAFKWEHKRLVPVDPTGPALLITLTWTDDKGDVHTDTIPDWIVSANTGEHLPRPADAWRFAGSAFVERQGETRYSADYDGLMIGLATFGTEMISFEKTFSPDSGLEAPEWIADKATLPAFGTEVVVRLEPRGG